MKHKNKLMALTAALIVSANVNTANAQVDVTNHTYNSAYYVGWSSANDLPFKLNGTQYMTLKSTGDLNLNTSTNAFQIAGHSVLWNNNITGSIYVGVNAGNATTNASANTFVGNNTGVATTSGSGGTFIGFEAGIANTSASGNVAIGYQAMHSSATMLYNTAIGYQALYTQSTCPLCWDGKSALNTAVGYQTLYNTSAYGGCAFGYMAASSNTSGCSTTAIGENALLSNQSGDDNVAVGSQSCVYNVTGAKNTCVGDNAGHGASGQSHNNNSFFGSNAGQGITVGHDNAFMGRNSGYSNTTGSLNTFIGDSSGYTNTSGVNNVLLGFQAGYSNGAASSVTACGYQALYTNYADYNTAFGRMALKSNTYGNYNTGCGVNALYLNTTGNDNTAIGFDVMHYNTASENTACGFYALYNSTSGGYNTAFGKSAGYTNTTGDHLTFLGYGADVNANNLSNSTAVGNGAVATASNFVALGNTAITKIEGQVAVTLYSDGRFKTNVTENVKGLEFIKKLRPVTYKMDTKALDDFIIQNMPDSAKIMHQAGMDFAPSKAMIHSGFIAQEVELAAQQVGFISSIVSAPSNNTDPYALAYSEFVVPLVKAVQELSKTADSLKTKTINQDSINAILAKKDSINAMKLQAVQNKTNQLDSINASLQNQINQLMTTINACCAAHSTKSLLQNSDSQTAANQTDVELSNKNIVVLDQNVPNPFAEQTTINYFLPDNITRAQIIFLDQSGKLIKAVDLIEKGKGILNVFANDLTSGIYTYSLIIDGQTMETKKMMKAK